jgi:hypothetical protein
MPRSAAPARGPPWHVGPTVVRHRGGGHGYRPSCLRRGIGIRCGVPPVDQRGASATWNASRSMKRRSRPRRTRKGRARTVLLGVGPSRKRRAVVITPPASKQRRSNGKRPPRRDAFRADQCRGAAAPSVGAGPNAGDGRGSEAKNLSWCPSCSCVCRRRRAASGRAASARPRVNWGAPRCRAAGGSRRRSRAGRRSGAGLSASRRARWPLR